MLCTVHIDKKYEYISAEKIAKACVFDIVQKAQSACKESQTFSVHTEPLSSVENYDAHFIYLVSLSVPGQQGPSQ